MCAADKGGKHFLGRLKIVNRAVAHRAVNFCIVRFAPQEFVGFGAYGEHFTTVFVNCDGRRFIQNDAYARRENHCVNRSEVDRQLIRKEIANNSHNVLIFLIYSVNL